MNILLKFAASCGELNPLCGIKKVEQLISSERQTKAAKEAEEPRRARAAQKSEAGTGPSVGFSYEGDKSGQINITLDQGFLWIITDINVRISGRNKHHTNSFSDHCDRTYCNKANFYAPYDTYDIGNRLFRKKWQ